MISSVGNYGTQRYSANKNVQNIPKTISPSFGSGQTEENKSAEKSFLSKHWGKIAVSLAVLIGGAILLKNTKQVSKGLKEVASDAVSDSGLNQHIKRFKDEWCTPLEQKAKDHLIKRHAEEIIAPGDTVAQRLESFNKGKYFAEIDPKIIDKTPSWTIEPHTYKTDAQDIFFSSATYNSDFPLSKLKLEGPKQVYTNISPGVLPTVEDNLPEVTKFVVGITRDGRAFVEYVIPTKRLDRTGSAIREFCSIISKDGDFTPAQIDLMKTLGAIEPDGLTRNNAYPMLSNAVKEHKLPNDILANEEKRRRIAVSEDGLLSGIYTWAKNVGEVKNKFIDGYKALKNGEYICTIEKLSENATHFGNAPQ